ncbi:hypothetical protein M427DRAFT_36619 [Gonapodya prolifera JEL478]|uniref:L domain-like protein n=1 Tax=Gonapodya prolifera (strain JEL478) TaxID=1344416 RepID=A0A139A1Z1_GONPJ|nr:hypothetical protein M427DRAFT_36619 [Gonapodya prolifera JEL478]|eukprot:KXS10810.1 hypothetical protein M427DRAFT_36619 [Gonapodya prolifera JEL478]
MTDPVNVYIIWYGANWTPTSKAIITDFIAGFDQSDAYKVATNARYFCMDNASSTAKTFVSSSVKLNGQSEDPSYSLRKLLNSGKSENYDNIFTVIQENIQAGRLFNDFNGIYLVLTDNQTLEAGFLRGYCSKVGSAQAAKIAAQQTNDGRFKGGPDVRWVFAGSSSAAGEDGALGCTSFNTDISPNGNPDVDIIIDGIANEILNFVVNPWADPSLDAWTDKPDEWNDGFGPAANCAFNYGNTAVDGRGALYNEQWNGRNYLIQGMWDPEVQLCQPRSVSVPSDCAILQQILGNQTYLGDDCCNSGKNSMGAGPVPESICQFQNLEILRMGNFTTAPTSLPDCFGNLTKLELLVVVDNSGLTGPIPQSLTTLSNLRQVLLDGNDFTGNIPDFSKSPKLSAFSASGNSKLSGTLISGYQKLDNPLLNQDGTYDASCDLSGTQVCLPAGYVGPDCELKSC